MRRSMGQTMNEEEPNYLVTYKTIINNIFDLKISYNEAQDLDRMMHDLYLQN